jgi:stage III sporulation protein AG
VNDFFKWLSRWISKSNERISGKSDSQDSSGSPGPPSSNSPLRSFRWLFILGLTGAALMIITSFISVEQEVMPIPKSGPNADQQAFIGKNSEEPMTMSDYEEMYEAELREILQEIVGVGAVSVMVTIESTEEIVVKENVNSRKSTTEEKDKQGATRLITDIQNDGQVVIYNAQQGEKPIIIKTIKPQIRGILIVAKGAENVRIEKMITDAVRKSLSVPAYRISVLPKKH